MRRMVLATWWGVTLAILGCSRASEEATGSEDAGARPVNAPAAPQAPEPSAEPDAENGAGGEGNRPSPAASAGSGAEPEPAIRDAGSPGPGVEVDASAPARPTRDAGRGGSADAGVDGSPALTPDPPPAGEPIAVAVGYGMRRVSSRNGLDWEHFEELVPDGGDDDNLFRGLTFGGGRFVAVGGSGSSLSLVSTDGETWHAEDRQQGDWIGGVAWLDGGFVAAGGNGLRVHSEDLGETWRDPVGYQAVHYRDVASGGGVVVAVGHTYGESPDVGIIAMTADGRQWTEVGRGGAGLGRVAFGNGVFVAQGEQGRLSRSTDGVNWQDDVVGGGGGTVVFAAGEFVVSTADGVFVSADGRDFTLVEGSSRPVDGYIAGVYLSLDWPARIHASTNLVDWTPVFEPMGSGFTRIVTGTFEP